MGPPEACPIRERGAHWIAKGKVTSRVNLVNASYIVIPPPAVRRKWAAVSCRVV